MWLNGDLGYVSPPVFGVSVLSPSGAGVEGDADVKQGTGWVVKAVEAVLAHGAPFRGGQVDRGGHAATEKWMGARMK